MRLITKVEPPMEEEGQQESNPVVEALQAELDKFRNSPFQLTGSDFEKDLGELVKQSKKNKPILFSFLGIPGAGKSKLIEKLSRLYNVPPIHVRDLAVVSPEWRKLEKEYYQKSEIIPGVERDFLNLVFKDRTPYLLVDGFPRSVFQALELYKSAVQKKYRVIILETRLTDGKEVYQSYYRQTTRANFRVKKGLLFGQALDIEEERILSKIRRALDLDLFVIETLRHLGAEMLVLDASPGPSKMFNQFKEALANKLQTK
jgi:adenylate kinase family enzyme